MISLVFAEPLILGPENFPNLPRVYVYIGRPSENLTLEAVDLLNSGWKNLEGRIPGG